MDELVVEFGFSNCQSRHCVGPNRILVGCKFQFLSGAYSDHCWGRADGIVVGCKFQSTRGTKTHSRRKQVPVIEGWQTEFPSDANNKGVVKTKSDSCRTEVPNVLLTQIRFLSDAKFRLTRSGSICSRRMQIPILS